MQIESIPAHSPASSDTPREHRIEIGCDEEETLSAAEEAAEVWGADWRRTGRLVEIALPVKAGLRRGLLRGSLFAEPSESGSQLIFQVEESQYQVAWREFLVLLMGAAGGLSTIVIPFFPHLYPLLPMAFLLPLVAWFLVVSRSRSRGAQDFLDLVAEVAATEQEADSDAGNV